MHRYILLDLSKKKKRELSSVWDGNILLTWRVIGDFFLVNRDLIFLNLWIVINSDKILWYLRGRIFYLNVHELWVESWIERDSWTILFCVMHFRLFYRFGNVRIFLERFWLGFDKGFDKRWKSYGSIIVTKQISNGSWTNEIGHCSIVCHVRLVKIKESIISILRDFF